VDEVDDESIVVGLVLIYKLVGHVLHDDGRDLDNARLFETIQSPIVDGAPLIVDTADTY